MHASTHADTIMYHKCIQYLWSFKQSRPAENNAVHQTRTFGQQAILQGEHKDFPRLQTCITIKLRGIQTFLYHYLTL